MSDQPIPDEAVEAALAATDYDWDARARGEVGVLTDALQAAAPIIRQQALAEARARVGDAYNPPDDDPATYTEGFNDALAAIEGTDDE